MENKIHVTALLTGVQVQIITAIFFMTLLVLQGKHCAICYFREIVVLFETEFLDI